MADQVGLVELGSAGQHGGGDGDAGAAADVADQVHEARRVAGLLRRDVLEGKHVDGNEEEREAEALHHPRHHGGLEIDLEAEAGYLDKAQAAEEEAHRDEPAGIEQPNVPNSAGGLSWIWSALPGPGSGLSLTGPGCRSTASIGPVPRPPVPLHPK